MYTGALSNFSGGRSWCTAGAMTSTNAYVSYPSNIQPIHDAISALRLALPIDGQSFFVAAVASIDPRPNTALNIRGSAHLASEATKEYQHFSSMRMLCDDVLPIFLTSMNRGFTPTGRPGTAVHTKGLAIGKCLKSQHRCPLCKS
jgi:hypothetical protein